MKCNQIDDCQLAKLFMNLLEVADEIEPIKWIELFKDLSAVIYEQLQDE